MRNEKNSDLAFMHAKSSTKTKKKTKRRRTVSLFDVVPPRRSGRVIARTRTGTAPPGNMRHLEHRHGAVEQAVHGLESGGLVAPHRRGVPLVARLALAHGVLEHDVGHLEDAYRQRVRAVLSDRLEQARQERRAYHLELERLWVRDLDRRLAVVGRVEPSKVFLVRALDDGETGETCR